MRRKKRGLKKSKFSGWTERTEVHGTILYVHKHERHDGTTGHNVTMEGTPPTDSIIKLIELWCEALAEQVTLSEYLDWVLARDLNTNVR